MTHKLSDVSSRYGAPMGRPEHSHVEPHGRIYLNRVRINSGGYDEGGAYWGIGQPLFHAVDCEGVFESFFRARDRQAAKQVIRDQWEPLGVEVKFYR